MRSDLITEKLTELIALSVTEGEPNTQIVLLALAGARSSGDSGLLATNTQEFIREILLPNAEHKLTVENLTNNDHEK